MMKYEIFKEVVADTFKDYLPEQYKEMEMQVVSVNKVNRVLDGINLIGGREGTNVSPTIYINDMYDHYKLCNDLKEAIRSGAERMVKAFRECPEIPKIELSEAKDNIVFQLVNTEQNREMLADVPHREYQDLSVIYRWVVKVENDGVQSIVMRNGLAEQLGLNEGQLFKLAAENTRRIFPPVIKSMNDVIIDTFVKDGMPREVAEMMIEEMAADNVMYVISNNTGINGAVSMLYENELHKLANQMDNLSVSDKHYDKKYEDMQIRLDKLYDEIEEIETAIEAVETRLYNIIPQGGGWEGAPLPSTGHTACASMASRRISWCRNACLGNI